MRLLACVVLTFHFFTLFSQKPVLNKYFVEFKDKANSPYCMCRPWEFLSAQSLMRREKESVPLEFNDLPVNPAYLNAIKKTGVAIHGTTRWLNGAAIVADSAGATRVLDLSFVKSVSYIGRHLPPRFPLDPPLKLRPVQGPIPTVGDGKNPFGYATMQLSQLEMPILYMAGVRGQNIPVAVMDGGFINVDILPFFDSVAIKGNLVSGHDFVDGDSYVFEAAGHGTSVLSVMASNLPGYFLGSAPEASYICLRTEDTGGEYPIEEFNWIQGAEYADSIGAWVVNASLGYTTFNDTTLNHTFAQLNGKTTLGSRGAAIAATKGMIICNSAGNSGDEPWHFTGVPADAKGIIAVGATTREGMKAEFSSWGPTADGRIKPDLSAPGDPVVAANLKGYDLGMPSGTSVASPMLAGSIAALWSSAPEKTSGEILDAVYQHASQADKPDNGLGYGVPNMFFSWADLQGYYVNGGFNLAKPGFFAYPIQHDGWKFLIPVEAPIPVKLLAIRDAWGRNMPIRSFELHSRGTAFFELEINQTDLYPSGLYTILVQYGQTILRLNGAL